MLVKIKMIHQAYQDIFQIDDIVELHKVNDKHVISKDGKDYGADDMCKCFSNNCVYSDIFDKV